MLLIISAVTGCCARRRGLGWNSDYCTNCSGPIPLHAGSPGIFGAGLRGHGGEAFVKHIASHM
eukprot:SAG22_NODE_9341_length_594_cov_1.169697_1_plen_62_part_01